MLMCSHTPPARVLLIDDDLELAQMLREYLEPDHCTVTLAHTREQGETLLARNDYDVALLDLMLPDGNGLDLLRLHRARSQRPVIMFTAHGDEADRVLGLELGADDYLSKPFSPRELRARMHAVLRRFQCAMPAAGASPWLEAGALRLNLASGEAVHGAARSTLTGAEQRVLEILMRSAGRVVAREEIGRFALGRAPERYDRSLDTHVSALRRKLSLDGTTSPLRIRNLRGQGYLLVQAP
ncbi:response regulator transcription factor [Cupriavidus taiwanensis]|uniref:response regulator transcription factor n=1 Tax=Cupriavidus taiwanensis TaxID=164546 RepID=UPI000E18F2E4|nr:response regulator transcription factor [Cupriavidus taiwanensis]SOY58800.1 response regulator in two-component regulatory system with CpxA, regulates genes involved in folding/degrading periplasmic proteins (OmpR family) [Cupriavidus taiwanensis]